MEKIIYFCDRCKKEIEKPKEKSFAYRHFHDLCDNCKEDLKIYEQEIDKLQEKFDELEKKYCFGDYIEEYLKKEDK